MLRGILFDLGDTLLDFEPMDTRALFAEAARHTYDELARRGYRLPTFARYAATYRRSIKWAYLWAKLTGREFNSHELLARFHRRFGLPEDQALLREMSWAWYVPILNHAQVEDGLTDTLAHLRAAGLELGVVSNTFVPAFVHDRHLDMLGLLELLPRRIYSSEVGYRKPDRRIFRAGCQALKLHPSEVLFVGDLVKTDIIGARRAGMRTALKQPWSNSRPHPLADYIIHKVADLLQVVPDLLTGARATHS